MRLCPSVTFESSLQEGDPGDIQKPQLNWRPRAKALWPCYSNKHVLLWNPTLTRPSVYLGDFIQFTEPMDRSAAFWQSRHPRWSQSLQFSFFSWQVKQEALIRGIPSDLGRQASLSPSEIFSKGSSRLCWMHTIVFVTAKLRVTYKTQQDMWLRCSLILSFFMPPFQNKVVWNLRSKGSSAN